MSANFLTVKVTKSSVAAEVDNRSKYVQPQKLRLRFCESRVKRIAYDRKFFKVHLLRSDHDRPKRFMLRHHILARRLIHPQSLTRRGPARAQKLPRHAKRETNIRCGKDFDEI